MSYPTKCSSGGGINLETWESLFEGSRGGSPIVPYRPDLSYLLFSVNNDSTLGPVLLPTMPFSQDPLTSQEYYDLWQWIDDGARDANGEERFPPDPARKKWYIGHNQCDDVAVFDAESRQVMRYIPVGQTPGSIELVLDIEISPDGKDWFVVFFNDNEYISRYSTTTDEKVADIPMGNFGWSAITFSPDSRFAFVYSEYWRHMAVVDLTTNSVVAPPTVVNVETRSPKVHPLRQQVYLTEHADKGLFVLDYDQNGILSNPHQVDLIQGVPSAIPGDIWPFELFFLPDGSKYFVTCSHSNEVRVLDAQTDTLMEVIVLPASPTQLTYSAATERLFVACMNDAVSWTGEPEKLGSVITISTVTHQVEGTTYAGFQPYAITADDANGVLVVANRNTDLNGPQPHHVSTCGGRNGYVTLIDLNSLELVPGFKTEILVDPITIANK